MSFELGRRLLRTNEHGDRPPTFSLLGREWDLLDGVFAPVFDLSTQMFTSWLPVGSGDSVLEIGCGAGVTAVTAALAGARVTAVDISAPAVENTLRNVRRHGVEDRVRVLRSDMFASLAPDDRFDIVCWNSSFIEPPVDYELPPGLACSIFDPGYEVHRRFLAEAHAHTTPAGRVFLGFSQLGNQALLDSIAKETGLEVIVARRGTTPRPPRIEYQLLELVRAPSAG